MRLWPWSATVGLALTKSLIRDRAGFQKSCLGR
jgi:hypothetical protein